MAPRVDKEYRDEIEKVRAELQNLVTSKEKFNAPDLLRLAYASQFSIANSHHEDAGITTSTDATTKTAQSANNNLKTIDAGITTSTDATTKTAQSANNNLKTIAKIKGDHPTITYPDLYQLAGVVAVEELGGPTIEFIPGREDSSISPDEGCLPDVKQSLSDLRKVFDKVGISDAKHITALCGGLKLARSGSQGSTLKFDNSYFVDLDKALLDGQEFRDYVLCYAKNNEAFIKDYKEAHQKLSELGLPHSPFIIIRPVPAVVERTFPVNTVTQRAVGVAVAATVVILGVFYLINRRRAKHSLQQFH